MAATCVGVVLEGTVEAEVEVFHGVVDRFVYCSKKIKNISFYTDQSLQMKKKNTPYVFNSLSPLIHYLDAVAYRYSSLDSE